MREKIGASTIISAICAFITAVLLVYITSTVEFPYFPYVYRFFNPVTVTPSTPTVGQEMSRFLWENRGLDLIAQAVLLFASASGCIAMLRTEKKGR